jgi:hypothetical protein
VRTQNALGTADSVCRIDPRTNRVVASIPIAQGVLDLAAEGASVWVLQGGTDVPSLAHRAVLRIDTETNRGVASIAAPRGARFLAAGYGLVWAAASSSIPFTQSFKTQLVRLDARTDEVVGVPIETSGRTLGMAASPGGVWILNDWVGGHGGSCFVDGKTGQVAYKHNPSSYTQCIAFGEGTAWVGAGCMPNLGRHGDLHRLEP